MNRLAVAAAALLAVAACGGGDDYSDDRDPPVRVVEITMTDIAFSPATLTAKVGEMVTYRFRNDGKLAHDAYFGDAKAQADHEKEMRADGGGHAHGAGDKDAITVEAGKTGELRHRFDQPGTFEIGCHQPGHYGAGMKVTVTVTR